MQHLLFSLEIFWKFSKILRRLGGGGLRPRTPYKADPQKCSPRTKTLAAPLGCVRGWPLMQFSNLWKTFITCLYYSSFVSLVECFLSQHHMLYLCAKRARNSNRNVRFNWSLNSKPNWNHPIWVDFAWKVKFLYMFANMYSLRNVEFILPRCSNRLVWQFNHWNPCFRSTLIDKRICRGFASRHTNGIVDWDFDICRTERSLRCFCSRSARRVPLDVRNLILTTNLPWKSSRCCEV